MAKASLAVLILIILLLTPFLAIPQESNAQASSDDWPMFQHDPAHTGFTNSSAPTTMPAVLWRRNRSNDPETSVPLSPVVVDGVVYVTGSYLDAYNASTGEVLWRQADAGWSTLAVENGIIYTVDGAFNLSTGSELWKNHGSTFAVSDGYYYTDFTDWKGGGTFFMAVNALTGISIWNFTADLTDKPAIAGGHVYFGANNHFYAVNAYNGSKLWDFGIHIAIESSPTVADGYVYVSGGTNQLYCLNASSGKQVWNSTIGPLSSSSPAVANGFVYIGSSDGKLYAFNAFTGSKIWSYTTQNTEKGYGIESSPVVADKVVYVGADDGYLYALNALTGYELWSYKIGDIQHFRSSPAIANGRIYIGSQDNFMVALEASPTLTFAQLALIITVVTVVSVAGGLLIKRHRTKKS